MPDEQSLIRSLFTTIEDVIFYGDRLDQGQMVSMMSPGQFLSTNLKETRPADLFVQYDVTDPCLDVSFIRKPLTSTLSRQYEELFRFAALPAKALTTEEYRQLQRDIQVTDDYRDAYMKYRSVFTTADADYQTALNDPSTTQVVLAKLADARIRALQQWDTQNVRRLYEDAYADMLYLQSGNPITYFQELDQQRQRYKATSTAGDYYRTSFEPPVAQWDGASWTKAILDTSTIASTSYSRSTGYSGGVSVGWGIFSFGGSGGHSESYQHDHCEATKMRAELEYLRVKIARPWFVSDIFNYRFWTWKKTHGFTYMSDGAVPPAKPVGTVPLIPMEMLVVRNVTLTADFTATDNQKIVSHTSGGASCGIGPFSISGTYTQDSTEVNVSASMNDASITIAQPQVLAFLCALTPQSPNPDPSLPWQGDETMPFALDPSYIEAIKAERERHSKALDATLATRLARNDSESSKR